MPAWHTRPAVASPSQGQSASGTSDPSEHAVAGPQGQSGHRSYILYRSSGAVLSEVLHTVQVLRASPFRGPAHCTGPPGLSFQRSYTLCRSSGPVRSEVLHSVQDWRLGLRLHDVGPALGPVTHVAIGPAAQGNTPVPQDRWLELHQRLVIRVGLVAWTLKSLATLPFKG